MIVDSNYLPSKSWSFEKKRRFVNQSICIWWSHLSFADKVCRQRRQRQFDDFSWRFFFRKCREFCSILEVSDDMICFFNRISEFSKMYWKIQLPYAFSDQHRRFDDFFDDFFSESGGNFALQRAPLLTEFSKYALRAVTPVKFKQTALYDVACGYLELFNYWYCLVFYDIFWY